MIDMCAYLCYDCYKKKRCEVQVMSFLFTENSFAYETKNKLQSGAGAWSGLKKELEWRADEHMTRGQWSVT